VPTPPLDIFGDPQQERILLYGMTGSRKSSAWLQVALWHQRMQSDARFHVIHTDNSLSKLMGGSRFGSLRNVVKYDVDNMQEYLDAGSKIHDAVRPHDFFVVDLIDDAWMAAQDEYSDIVEGENLDKLWLTQRAAGSDRYPIEGWNWGVIKKRYGRLATRRIEKANCHVIACARTGQVREASGGNSGDDQAIKDWFQSTGGVKPGGEKNDPYRFHTIIFLTVKRDVAKMQIMKDRERELGKFEYTDFFRDYMVGRAGWTLT